MTRRSDTRVIGTMRGFVRDRGFAFADDREGREFFVHRSGCATVPLYDELRDGDVVSFQTLPTAKGQRAFDVRRATETEAAMVAGIEESRGNR